MLVMRNLIGACVLLGLLVTACSTTPTTEPQPPGGTHVPALGADIKREDVPKQAQPAFDRAVASERQWQEASRAADEARQERAAADAKVREAQQKEAAEKAQARELELRQQEQQRVIDEAEARRKQAEAEAERQRKIAQAQRQQDAAAAAAAERAATAARARAAEEQAKEREAQKQLAQVQDRLRRVQLDVQRLTQVVATERARLEDAAKREAKREEERRRTDDQRRRDCQGLRAMMQPTGQEAYGRISQPVCEDTTRSPQGR